MGHPGESEKRKQILKAAIKVFSQKGFHEAKVDEIAQLADVGKGTVYEYFSSKTELFQEMFKAGIQLYIDNLEKSLKKGMSCRDKLSRIAASHLRFIVKYKDLARITMSEHAYFDESFRKWVSEHRGQKLQILEQIIKEGVDSGEFRPVNSYAAALAFMGSIGSILPHVIFSKDGKNYKELVEPVIDIILNGLNNKK